MKNIFLIFALLFSSSIDATASEKCNKEILVDDVTELAFGARGELYSGKLACFFSNNKIALQYSREFSKGIPVGEHFCYRKNGSLIFSVVYENGQRVQRGYLLYSGEMRRSSCFNHELNVNYCFTIKPNGCF